MKILSIEAIPFQLPLIHPVKFAAGELRYLEHVLVRIQTDEGPIGHAEAPARQMIYGETSKSIVAAIQDYFAPALVGLDVFAIERAWQKMEILPWNHCAKAGVDMALHDIIAQVAGLPLYKLLGGYQNTVDVCHILGFGPPASVAQQAVALRDELGICWFKLKAGVNPVAETSMIETVREAVGSDVMLTVDCNQGYSATTAERVIPTWDRFDLAWIEEPCPGKDSRGRERVAAVSRTPFMLDESAYTIEDVTREIALGSCRIAGIKVARSGMTMSRRILNLATAYGLGVVVGSQAESELGTLYSTHFAAAHRATSSTSAELSFFLEASERITVDTLKISNGKLTLSDRPGLGFDVDNERLDRLRIDR